MKAVCSNNPEHDRFITVAHVTQDWVVDENGNFLEVAEECLEVTHGPDKYNSWICDICGAEATISDN